MAVVLRYVTETGFIQERLLDLIHVPDTASKTLKDAIFFLLGEHKLSVENIRGQGYDGASNMSGKWKGLRALVSNECRFAYFIHCFAHQLQLALVAAAKEVRAVYGFFENKLPFIINFFGGSCKRIEELKQAQTNEIELLIAHDDVETERVCTLLEVIRDGPGTASQRGDAESAYKTLVDFEFVFILHMMKEIPEINNDLSQLLQRKSQDIVNAMDLLRKLNNKFSETTNELMVLCVALDPKDGYKMFNIENICRLVEKYYPDDFTENEKEILKIQLRQYKEDVTNHPKFKNLSLISELCQTLGATGKYTIYPLVDRLIRNVLTLPVSTTSAERSFSDMNHIKTEDRNKMDDIFLSDSLVIYTEKEITRKISTDSIIDVLIE